MRISSLVVLLSAALLCSSALAQTHEVKMLTRSATAGMVYEPDYLQIAPGDTVKFVAIQCIPHLAMGMVMLIQVGEPATQAPQLPATLPKRALDRMNAALQKQQASQ